jgi:hypothetical protein
MLKQIHAEIAGMTWDYEDEADLLASVQRTRTELVQAYARNDHVEKELKIHESTLSLLIQHRASLGHAKTEKKKYDPSVDALTTAQLYKDHALRSHYSNLFYLYVFQSPFLPLPSY